MIVAHLADLHLGFSAYERREAGRNAREADVERAFLAALDDLARIRPDVVLIAGDVFDRPDPPASALVALTRGLALLRDRLPGTPVLIAAGPRDTPRNGSEMGVLAALDALPGVQAATDSPRSVRVGEELSVCLLPHGALERGVPDPDPGARWNVLVTHGRDGASSDRAAPPSGTAPLGPAIDPAAWDYVALGGEHVQRAPLPHVRWAGSLERVGWSPWEEALEEKGFLTWDLESGRTTFHPVAVRAVVSLAPIRATASDPDRLRRQVREVTDEVPGGIEGKVVLVRVHGADPADLDGLGEDLLPALRARALHLSVVLEEIPRSAVLRTSTEELAGRLAALLEEEGVSAADAPARAAALLGAPVREARAS